MDRYAVFAAGAVSYRLHGVYADRGRAVEHYNRLASRAEAVLALVGDAGTVTVLAAGGLSTEGVARDPVFLDAVRGAVG